MALRECCDVYGSANGVKRFRIHIEKQVDVVEGCRLGDGVTYVTLIDETKSFCPRAKERFLKGIGRLTSPPAPREKATEATS